MEFQRRKDIEGSGNHMAKLTERQVKNMRRMLDTGQYKLREVAKKYDVSIATVWRIKHRENWRQL